MARRIAHLMVSIALRRGCRIRLRHYGALAILHA